MTFLNKDNIFFNKRDSNYFQYTVDTHMQLLLKNIAKPGASNFIVKTWKFISSNDSTIYFLWWGQSLTGVCFMGLFLSSVVRSKFEKLYLL